MLAFLLYHYLSVYQVVYSTETYICKGQGEDYHCDLITDEKPSPEVEVTDAENINWDVEFDRAIAHRK